MSVVVNFQKLALAARFSEKKLIFDISEKEFEVLAKEAKPQLREWALKFEKEEIILRSRSMNSTLSIKPLEVKTPVPASRAIASEALVHTDYSPKGWSKAWIETLIELETQEKPAVLLELVSGQQIWCNQLAADVMKLSPEELLKIKSYEHWVDGEFDRLWSEVRAGLSSFDFAFETIHCQSGDRLQMQTSNKILELDGVFYRLSVANEVAVMEMS